jgi:hypothetical protein
MLSCANTCMCACTHLGTSLVVLLFGRLPGGRTAKLLRFCAAVRDRIHAAVHKVRYVICALVSAAVHYTSVECGSAHVRLLLSTNATCTRQCLLAVHTVALSSETATSRHVRTAMISLWDSWDRCLSGKRLPMHAQWVPGNVACMSNWLRRAPLSACLRTCDSVGVHVRETAIAVAGGVVYGLHERGAALGFA